MQEKENLTLYIISDATGETAKKVALATLTQFPDISMKIKRFPYVLKETDIEEIFQEINSPGIIIYTMVKENIKQKIIDTAKNKNMITIDILEPIMNILTRLFKVEPNRESGIMHKLDENYFKMVEAVEFTVNHDDGARFDDYIKNADIILIGISRTSKTPLSIYLAYQGYKVANIPFITSDETIREQQLKSFDKLIGKNIVALTIDPVLLQKIRKERALKIGLENPSYYDLQEIRKELIYANNIYLKYNWPIVNVSRKAVEEVATEILKILGYI